MTNYLLPSVSRQDPTLSPKNQTNLLQRLARAVQSRPKRSPRIPQMHPPLIIRSREQVFHARIPPDARKLAIVIQRRLRGRAPRLDPPVAQDDPAVFAFQNDVVSHSRPSISTYMSPCGHDQLALPRVTCDVSNRIVVVIEHFDGRSWELGNIHKRS